MLTALVFGAMLVAPQVEAQTRFGIAAGLAVPTGDFADLAKSGFNVEGSVEFRPATMPFGIRADVFFNQFGFDEDFENFVGADGNFRAFGGALSGIFQMAGVSATPYLLVGPTITNLDVDIDDSSVDLDSETKFGLQGGVGVKFPLSGFTSKLEARYHTIFTDDENTNMFTINFGVLFGGNN
ncbi:MAG TPA: outer membrane beta-barrel protein [Gemmatimonadaceae bacterium]|nr:outer membrane beta-barrel protein [Gemmatimonadaceae bacterium]